MEVCDSLQKSIYFLWLEGYWNTKYVQLLNEMDVQVYRARFQVMVAPQPKQF